MIGNNVVFSHVGILKEGIVLDKYIGYKSVKNEIAHKAGGTMKVNQHISVDFYIIKVKKEFMHIECSRIKSFYDGTKSD